MLTAETGPIGDRQQYHAQKAVGRAHARLQRHVSGRVTVDEDDFGPDANPDDARVSLALAAAAAAWPSRVVGVRRPMPHGDPALRTCKIYGGRGLEGGRW